MEATDAVDGWDMNPKHSFAKPLGYGNNSIIPEVASKCNRIGNGNMNNIKNQETGFLDIGKTIRKTLKLIQIGNRNINKKYKPGNQPWDGVDTGPGGGGGEAAYDYLIPG